MKHELATDVGYRPVLVSSILADDGEVIVDKVNVYLDAAGEYRWERRASNGRIIADSGEGYKNAKDCIEMALKVNKGASAFFLGQPIVGFQQ